jgi:TonB C terminal/HEAT repeats
MRALGTLAAVAGAVICVQSAPRGEPAGAQAEPAITLTGVEGDYLRALHVRIHWRWAHVFIEGVAMRRPPTDPLNDPKLSAEVLFTVRWDGSAAEVTLSKKSGQKAFDNAALEAVRGDMPYPVPPLALFGDDGVAHFRWVLARDYRMCSEGEIRRREDPLEEALPRLFIQGRVKEALLRVTRYMRDGDMNAMAVFARSWLNRPFTDRVADINAAAALARVGDRRQIDRLRPGLARAETVVVAARGLAALKVDLCATLDSVLRERDPDAIELAMTALREAGPAPAGSPCLATLTALVDDEAAPKPLRASALRTFAALDPAGARRSLIALLEDKSPPLRAAAALAYARPGGGRPTLYKLEPLLKDGSSEVRAAAAAGLVRACGELSFDYLQILFKDPKDNGPLVAMAPGLGERSSAASADLLAKMLKRNSPELTQAVTRALATRQDDKGRALFKPLADAAKRSAHTSPEMLTFLYAAASADQLAPMAKDPRLGILFYKALLKAKRHQEAADWLVANFDRLSPETLGDAFGAWLANPPVKGAVTQ